MASDGPRSSTLAISKIGSGYWSWGSVASVHASDNSYAACNMYGGTLREQTVGLTKDAGTSQAGSNLSTSANLPTSDTYVSYGGASNLWDTTWTPSEINDSNFGAFFQAYDPLNALDTRWLVAYGFGFTIDSGATIDGILLEIEQRQASGIAYVDHVRITVYYTEGGGGGAASRFLRRRTRRFQRAF